MAADVAVVDHQHLAAAGEGGQDGAGVAPGPGLAVPGGLAGAAVVGRQPVTQAPELHDHPAVDDERRGGHSPIGLAGAMVAQHVSRPQPLAAGELEGVEQTGGAQRVDRAAGDGRRGPGAAAADGGVERRPVGVHPDLAAGGELVAHHHLVVAALLLGDGGVADHRERRPALADVAPPELARRLRLPVTRQGGTRQRGVAARTVELGVVVRPGPGGADPGRPLVEGGVAGPAPADDRHQVAVDALDLEQQEAGADDRREGNQDPQPGAPRQAREQDQPDDQRQGGEKEHREAGHHPVLDAGRVAQPDPGQQRHRDPQDGDRRPPADRGPARGPLLPLHRPGG